MNDPPGAPKRSRHDQLAELPTALLTDREKAYLAAYDIATAYPGCLEHIYRGIGDAALDALSSEEPHQTKQAQ